MVAREAMPGVRAHGRAVATNTRNRADRSQSIQLGDGQTVLERRLFGPRVRCRLRLRRAARDIQSPADRVREDVIGAAFASDPRGLEYLVRAVCGGLERERHRRKERTDAGDEKCGSFHKTLLADNDGYATPMRGKSATCRIVI